MIKSEIKVLIFLIVFCSLALGVFLVTIPIYKVADEISKLKPQLVQIESELNVLSKKIDSSFLLK